VGRYASVGEEVHLTACDTYTESSPSGTGSSHAIVNGKLAPGAGNQKTLPCGMKVELYSHRLRYFTMTGQHLAGIPTTIEDRQPELTALHTEIFGQEKEAAQAPAGPNPTLDLSRPRS
jgi:putative DNA primase/helicase